MGKTDMKKLAARYKEYEGFGRVHNGETWAKMLNLSMNLFLYYTEEKGLTIEELYELRGIVYKESRKGTRMEETRETMERLLKQSGYPDIGVEVFRIPGQLAHKVTWNGEVIGKYFYKEGRLVLTNGEGIHLLNLLEYETMLVRTKGGWVWHPETKQALLDQIIGR